jgi:putative spermidine/putrescine transport system ATP-binding protein
MRPNLMAVAPVSNIDGGVGVLLADLRHSYGQTHALNRLTLELAPGEVVALLGPSGCGKTRVLRVLAGLEDLDSGRVEVYGVDITMLRANKRDMGMVFQAYSLFPHMTARQNIEFGRRLRRVPQNQRRARAGDMLDLVGLAAEAERYAHQMSGGQQQWIALARVLAIEPQVLLFDEPLSALDATVRVRLREEICRIQTDAGITTLLVTYEQEEALTITDRISVMYDRRVEKLDTSEAIHRRSATAFVREFVGVTNQISLVLDGNRIRVFGRNLGIDNLATPGSNGTSLEAPIRPEDLALSDDSAGSALVTSLVLRGAITSVNVQSEEPDQALRINMPAHDAMSSTVGHRVVITPRRDTTLVGNSNTALQKEDAA